MEFIKQDSDRIKLFESVKQKNKSNAFEKANLALLIKGRKGRRGKYKKSKVCPTCNRPL
jgi:hypothetical protein